MDSAVFLALVTFLQIVALQCTLGEIDDLVKERRMGLYRKRVVTSLARIVRKKIPFASGIEQSRAMDAYNCGNCFLSEKIAKDNACIKSCTRIARFSSVAPVSSESEECDTCVATSLKRPNRVCDHKCSVRQLTAIMADVVSDANTAREKALLKADVEPKADSEPAEPDNGRQNQKDATKSNSRELENKPDASELLDMFRINPDAKNEAEIYEVSGKVDESFLSGNENGTSVDIDTQTISRSADKKKDDDSGRFVRPKGRTGILSGSSHQLNTSDRNDNFVMLKNFIKANKFFHPDSKSFGLERSDANEDDTENRDTRTENLESSDYDSLENFNDDQPTKSIRRSGGGFNLRDILSERVTDLSDRQRARIIKGLNRLADEQLPRRSGYKQWATEPDGVRDSNQRHQKRTSDAFKVYVSNSPTASGVHSQQRGRRGGLKIDKRSGSLRRSWPIRSYWDDYDDDDDDDDDDYLFRHHPYIGVTQPPRAYFQPTWRSVARHE